jgi:hypothetical protein
MYFKIALRVVAGGADLGALSPSWIYPQFRHFQNIF